MLENVDFTPIAIVGYGCVYPPDAFGAERYWRNLREGVSGLGLPPANRWSWELYHDDDRSVPEKTYCRYGGFVNDYEFQSRDIVRERGVTSTNRTQQFALDVCLQAVAQTRRGRGALADSRSMLIMSNMLGDELLGETSLNYRKKEILAYLDEFPGFRSLDDARKSKIKNAFVDAVNVRFPRLESTSSELLLPTNLPRVVARVLGISGPSFLVDGACAGGLLVVDAAARYLHDRSADTVVAVAVMANMAATGNVAFAKIGGLSPDGSRPLDTSANGLIPSEGAGAVILKRLDDALASGDRVLAVIRGVASRTDGKGKAIYAPSTRGQVNAMRRVLDLAGLTLSDIDHVETHATATAAGDKVELASLLEVAGGSSPMPAPGSISVGSVKGLIGHSFPAAGMANLIKILVCLEREEIVPTHHVTSPQPQLNNDGGPFVVHRQLKPWPAGGRRRRALANAFGFGGVNASICVEDFDAEYHRTIMSDGADRQSLPERVPTLAVPALPERAPTRSGRAAIVGVSVRTSNSQDLVEVAQPRGGAVTPSGYPVERWHKRAAETYDPCGERRVYAIDFEFPWREYRIPPDTLKSIDRAQQLALIAAGDTFKDAGRKAVPNTAVIVGACAGLEAATTRNLLIRSVEYEAILRQVIAEHPTGDGGGNDIDVDQMVGAVRDALASFISPTTESALPGYMDNIVPGRIGNMFDLRAANIALDAGRGSFAVALDLGLRMMNQGECDELLVGGLSANLSDELVLAMTRSDDASNGVPAEGSAFFLLKPVESITAEDKVYAIVDGVDVVPGTIPENLDANEPDFFGAGGAMRLAVALGARSRERRRTVLVPLDENRGYSVRLSPPHTSGDRRDDGVAASRSSTGLTHPLVDASAATGDTAQSRVWRGLTPQRAVDLLGEIQEGRLPSETEADVGGGWSLSLSWRTPGERSAKATGALRFLSGARGGSPGMPVKSG